MTTRAGSCRTAASWLALASFLVLSCGRAEPEASGRDDPDPGATLVVTAMLDGRDLLRPTSPTSSMPSPSTTSSPSTTLPPTGADGTTAVVTGADALLRGGLDAFVGRRVALIANDASTVGDERLVDVLHRDDRVELVKLFAPEHGLTGAGGAGEEVVDAVDEATGLTVHSLYGVDRAPTPDALADVDALLFDLQDAGARFYTYTATMGLAMQSAAAAGVPFVVLDRPNPLGGDRPDGPIRDDATASFVGLYPVPALHGLTAGELARAITGEGWLDGLSDLDLRVVELVGWDRTRTWSATGLAWEPPSPGLPTPDSVLTYPATVLLEATTLSAGRGTDRPFGQFGGPGLDGPAMAERLQGAGLAGVRFEAVTFTPAASSDGSEVPHAGRPVTGVRLTVTDPEVLRPMEVGVHVLHHLLALAGPEVIDRPDLFDKLAGGAALRRDLLDGRPPQDIVASWSDDLEAWAPVLERYRLYGG